MRISTRIHWSILMQSLFFLACGVLCLTIPSQIISNANLLVGISVIVFGISAISVYLFSGNRKSESYTLLYAMITVAIGIILITTEFSFPFGVVMSIWAITNAIFKFYNAIGESINHCTNLIKYIDGLITLALGVLLVIRFTEGVYATLLILGIYLIYLSLKPAFFLVKLKRFHGSSRQNLDKLQD
ncbi:MAG: DUF308 domain-containing protein [Clostridia bacterium]|nr:DUF308 domain-containing protein [Clostridia bacterium]